MVGRLFRRVRTLWRGERVKEEIQRELDFQIAMEAAERERRGASAGEARRTALRDFGSVASTREAVQDARGLSFWDSVWQDVRYAVRTLRRAPGYTAATVATLALGIGANTAVFSVIHAAMLTPLPYAEPDRLVRVSLERRGQHRYLPGAAFVDLRAQSRTMDVASSFNYREEGADVAGPAGPERVRLTFVSANYFRVMGAAPLAGRVFSPEEERANARVAVISESVWRRYLGGSPDAIGRTLTLNGAPFEVVGVLPGWFEDPLQPQVQIWRPENLQAGSHNDWNNNRLSAIARLRPGVTIAAARAEGEALTARQAKNYGTQSPTTIRIVSLHDELVGAAGPMLYALLAAVGLLLLLACVNVATLTLARASARGHEISVRAALGSSRGRLLRQLLTESLALSLAGGLAGLLLARTVSGVLLAAAPVSLLQPNTGRLDAQVFAYCFAIAVLAGAVFGIVPALQGSRADLERVLREGGRNAGASRRQTRTWNALVVCQVAVALVLLVGAGLLLRSLTQLRAVGLGIQPDDVVTFQVHLPDGRYPDGPQRLAFHSAFHARLSVLPNVRAAGAISRLPVTGRFHPWGARIPGSDISHPAEQRVVQGDYFNAVGIPILRGRTFRAEDSAPAERRIVVSRNLAESVFPGADPVGRDLEILNFRARIIGVVGDVALTARGGYAGTIYHAHAQFATDRNWALTQVVATRGSHPNILAAVREELRAIDSALVPHDPQPLADVVARGRARERFSLQLIGLFAGLALVLAAVGLYGVLAYSVASRQKEIGIRMALGAPAASVRRMFVAMGGRLTAAGLVTGGLAALVLTQGLQSLVFGITPRDPLVFATAGVVLAAVAGAAAWIPARAAARVQPLDVLGR